MRLGFYEGQGRVLTERGLQRENSEDFEESYLSIQLNASSAPIYKVTTQG